MDCSVQHGRSHSLEPSTTLFPGVVPKPAPCVAPYLPGLLLLQAGAGSPQHITALTCNPGSSTSACGAGTQQSSRDCRPTVPALRFSVLGFKSWLYSQLQHPANCPPRNSRSSSPPPWDTQSPIFSPSCCRHSGCEPADSRSLPLCLSNKEKQEKKIICKIQSIER